MIPLHLPKNQPPSEPSEPDPQWELLTATGTGIFLWIVVFLTWNQPHVTTVLLSTTLWLQWVYHARPGDGIVMVSAALLGTPAEIAGIKLGEWIYHAPDMLWGIPIWMPLIWANLFAIFRRLSRAILAQLTIIWPKTNAWIWRKFFPSLDVWIAIYWATALLLMGKRPIILFLYAFFMLIIGILWNQNSEKVLFLVGGMIGSLGEFICIQAGYWHDNNPFFNTLGVDITLPLDWGLSAILIHRIAESLAHQNFFASRREGACDHEACDHNQNQPKRG